MEQGRRKVLVWKFRKGREKGSRSVEDGINDVDVAQEGVGMIRNNRDGYRITIITSSCFVFSFF